MAEFRIGQGVDVHAFAYGVKLILGGVHIPSQRGLIGHSDADAVLHALVDALLGAAGKGDIGSRFPDTDERWRGADSSYFIKEVWRELLAEGFTFVNCDITVLLEKPKIAPYISEMRERIAALLETSVDRIAVKATTSERLGFVGRSEGVFASAVVLLSK